jgi:protein TonB
MSYAQRKELSGNRTLAIIIVAVIQFTLGYAIVTGLAYNVIKHAAENLKTFDVEEEPPPPEQPPPPPKQETPPPPVVAPPPIVRTAPVAPVIQTVREAPPVVITPQAPPAPPPPPPAKITKATSAKGNLQGLFSGDDYPQDALRNEETGATTVSLSIGTDGRVTGCSVTHSSGSRSLDNATCRILRSRARFNPAKLSNGEPTTDSVSQTIRWQISG